MVGRFQIKCDICKKEIGRTDLMVESAQGGICKDCKFNNMTRGVLRGL